MMVGGIALVACALIAIVRQPSEAAPERRATRRRVPSVILVGLVGGALAASGPVPKLDLSPVLPSIGLMLERLRDAAVPSAMYSSVGVAACAVVSVFGQTVLFRNVVASRMGSSPGRRSRIDSGTGLGTATGLGTGTGPGTGTGWITASVLWSIAMTPWAPWTTLPGSFALGVLGETCGWPAAFLAHVLWSIGASAGIGIEGPASIAVQMIAFAIASGVARLVRGEPSRHQL
jgi:hypothetical protein